MNLECGEEVKKDYNINVDTDRRIVILNLIRHGYAEHNQAKDTYGTRAYFSNKYRFSQLVEKGKMQAAELRFMMNDIIQNIDRIYISPLDRAIQTTNIVFSGGTEVERNRIFVTDDLREIGYAHPCNERRTVSTLKDLYPDFNYTMMKSDLDTMFVNGDTENRFVSMIREIKDFVADWYRCRADRPPIVVLVSHESFLLDFVRNYLNLNLTSIDNCELVTFEIDIDKLI